jgi:hypothetical protein
MLESAIEEFNKFPSCVNYNLMLGAALRLYRKKKNKKSSKLQSIKNRYRDIVPRDNKYPNYFEWLLRLTAKSTVAGERVAMLHTFFSDMEYKVASGQFSKADLRKINRLIREGYVPDDFFGRLNEVITWKDLLPENRFYLKNGEVYNTSTKEKMAKLLRRQLKKSPNELDYWIKPIGDRI